MGRRGGSHVLIFILSVTNEGVTVKLTADSEIVR